MGIITLHYSVEPILKSTADKVAYILRHFAYNPGFTSSFFPDMELSLRGLAAKTANNPDATCRNIALALDEAFKRLMPDAGLQVDAGIVYGSSTFFTVQIKVTDSLGNLIIPAGKIEIKDNRIKLTFEGV